MHIFDFPASWLTTRAGQSPLQEFSYKTGTAVEVSWGGDKKLHAGAAGGSNNQVHWVLSRRVHGLSIGIV